MNNVRLLPLGVSLAIALGAGFLGSLFTAPAIDAWYATLVKPELAPPNWVFAPVWTALYVLMGVAAYLVWQKREALPGLRAVALNFYALQLGINVLWSFFFFAQQDIGLALGTLAVLWLLIVFTMFWFYKISQTAALLLVPYLAWVTFAGYLNYMFWVLN